MVTALIFMGGLGAAAALLLGIASRVFYVKEDPLIGEVENALPGANCGGCGFPGCRAAAESIVGGKADAGICVAGGFDTAVAVGAVMGVKVVAREPDLASTTCTFGTDEADLRYVYNGAQDCQAAMQLYGGSKVCPIGCIGLGSCVKACNFDALTIGADNLPKFNPKNCVGCGACVTACPKDIIGLTSTTRRMQAEYTAAECTAPCQRACPTGIDIPRYIRAVRHGLPEEALRVIKEKCPLPLICGRICPAPCEFDCRRNLAADEPVGINPLKRFAADYEMATGKHINPYKNADSGQRVAVIGAGAEGLAASYYLARLGHETILYEAKPKLGGILRYVISDGRLPDDILDHEIESILQMGVEAHTEKLLGRDFTIRSLVEDGFDAILLSTGGFDSRKVLGAQGEARPQLVPGLHLLFDLLEDMAQGRTQDLGKHVLIAGTTPESGALARDLRESGVEKVTILALCEEELLPADLQETRALAREGIFVRPAMQVTGLWGADDRLVGATIAPTTPRPGEPPAETLAVNTLIAAEGRIPELVIAPIRLEVEEGEVSDGETFGDEFVALGAMPTWRTVPTFQTLPSRNGHGIFTPPEPGRISDASAVVKAIVSGRRLVRGIHQHLSGSGVEPIDNLALEADEILNIDEVHDVIPAPRQGEDLSVREPSTAADWIAASELPGLTETEAKQEAERCLQCGLICYLKDQ